jgi:hypothetical protein
MKKGKFSKMVVTKELHKRFCETYPEHKMTWEQFYKLWQDIAAKIRYHTIRNPLGVKLGSYTGELKFQYLPYKFKGKDYNGSEKAGESINHLNIISKGKTGKVKWERRWAVKFNKVLQFYAFDETRELNKMADKYASEFPELIRISRNTLGGHSIWRDKKYRYEYKKTNG